MGRALELVTVQATAPSTGAAATACTGNSLTIRDSRKGISLLDIWTTKQAAGSVKFTSPFLHDTSVGMLFQAPDGGSILHRGNKQQLKTQDELTVTIEGSATAGDLEHVSYLVYYEDLPGISGRFISASELKRRMVDVYAVKNTLACDTSGCYSGSEAINADFDQLKANTDYAILGCTVRVGAHALRWVAPDWGNLGVGMPMLVGAEQWHNARYFQELSEIYGLPLIPVFNSSNKGLVTIDAVQDESGTDPVVSTVMARLR